MTAEFSQSAATALRHELVQQLEQAGDLQQLQQLRSRYLGRGSAIKGWQRQLGTLEGQQRSSVGKLLGELQKDLAHLLNDRKQELEQLVVDARLSAERIDITLPGRGSGLGNLHPVVLMQERICSLFTALGFTTEDGPEAEDDYHNFVALNIPDGHPAREMHDTFYLLDRDGNPSQWLMRTHTSPVQIHAMKRLSPPFQIICPGRVYRRDSDLTHSPVFHQIEGLWIDRDIDMSCMRTLLENFVRELFDDEELAVRFRPSFFPFTEPSAELDIACVICEGGKDPSCRSCKGSGWLEVMGCGMVDPRVFDHCGLDTEVWRGIAFGLGVERMAMLNFKIADLRTFYDNDLRFLKQFYSA